VAKWLDLAKRSGLAPRPPADAAAVRAAEERLDHPLTDDLRSLYAASDGLVDEYGYEYVLPVASLVSENELMRTDASFPFLYMPFDSLLFFGRLGNGDLLGHPVLAEGPRRDVFVWDHEDDSRTWYAADLAAAIGRLGSA
jgi:hypothetical protein